MTILRNSMLLRYTAAMALFSIAINTACANSGQVGIAPVSTTTLKESILFAIDRDPSISQQAAQLGIGQAQIDEARSGWMPQISLNGSTGHSQTTDSSGSLKNSAAWGLSLTQLLYDFGKTNNSISQSSAQRDSYRYQLMGTLSDVAEKTALSYVEVKRYSDLLQAAIDNVQALKNVEQLAKLRADAGVSSTSDELQTRTRIAGMQATVAQYHAALNSARARLAVLTGMQAEAYSPVPANLAVEPDSLNRIDYSLIPAVMAAQNMERSAQYGVETAKSQHWPTLSLKGGAPVMNRTTVPTGTTRYSSISTRRCIRGARFLLAFGRRKARGPWPPLRSIRRVSMSCKKLPSRRLTGPAHGDEWRRGSNSWKMLCGPAMFIKMNTP